MKKILAITICLILITPIIIRLDVSAEILYPEINIYPYEDIQLLQRTLKTFGYLAGDADGIYGPETEKALVAWYNDRNIDLPTFNPVEIVIDMYKHKSSFTEYQIYNDNDAIYILQLMLCTYGFYNNACDTYLGSNTTDAFNEFMATTCVDFGVNQENTNTKQTTEPDNPPLLAMGMYNGSMPTIHDKSVDDYTHYITKNKITPDWYKFLLQDYNPITNIPISSASNSHEIKRLQTKLTCLGYYKEKINGTWNDSTTIALHQFQTDNNLEIKDQCDQNEQTILFSRNAPYANNPVKGYKINVDTTRNRVYVKGWSGNGYNYLIKRFVCSCGTKSHPTIKGKFYADGPVDEWYYMYDSQVWVKWAFKINGPYYFHSILFENQYDTEPTEESQLNLGINASHGCVRLSVEDAEWIYTHVPSMTIINLY